MRFIPTRVHAILDYAAALLLIVVPMFWLDDGEPALVVPIVAGFLILGQSLLTNYEISLANLIPMPVHLAMDALVGLVVLASPWIFGFADTMWVPHVLLGLLEIGAAVTTQTYRAIPESKIKANQQKHAT